MLFRHRALAVDAVEHGEAEIEQLVQRRAGVARAATDPQHRPFRRDDARGEFVEFAHRTACAAAAAAARNCRSIAGRSIGVRCRSIGTSTLTGPVGGGQCIDGGTGQHADGLLRGANAIRALAYRAQHAELIGRVVHRAQLAIDEFGGGLAGDVQHGGAGETRLDQAADGVRGARAGGGKDDAETAG